MKGQTARIWSKRAMNQCALQLCGVTFGCLSVRPFVRLSVLCSVLKGPLHITIEPTIAEVNCSAGDMTAPASLGDVNAP